MDIKDFLRKQYGSAKRALWYCSTHQYCYIGSKAKGFFFFKKKLRKTTSRCQSGKFTISCYGSATVVSSFHFHYNNDDSILI